MTEFYDSKRYVTQQKGSFRIETYKYPVKIDSSEEKERKNKCDESKNIVCYNVEVTHSGIRQLILFHKVF
jgi:hypothetical protein